MESSEITLLIRQLLNVRSPEVGARLKQRLNALMISQNIGPFDESKFGYKKFGDFLEKTQSEYFFVDRSSPTDIKVSLLEEKEPESIREAQFVAEPEQMPIRSDIWQAFTNNNLQRKRFYDIENSSIKHFVEKDQPEELAEVSKNPQNFIEITPIPGTEQIQWMKDYLGRIPLAPPEKITLDVLVSQPYTSSLNSTFTRALGEHGKNWRTFRTNNVTRTIENWAKENNIAVSELYKAAPLPPPSPALSESITQRQRAIKLLELLTEEDITKLVLPFLATTLLIRSST